MSTCTARGREVDERRATASGSPCGTPARRSSHTSTSYGSNSAPVVPIAASTRPQLGSLPKIAALNRLLRATDRPTSTASSSVAALTDSIAMSWLAPSASSCSCCGEFVADLGDGGVELGRSGATPDAPLASSDDLVVGRHAAVGVQPIEGDARRGAQRGVERRGVDDGIGRDHDEHGGEARREHSGALCHAADRPAVAAARLSRFGRVSVVMIALGGIERRRRAERGRCGRRRRPGSCERSSWSPMSPVEQTSTSPAETPSASADRLGGRVRGLEALRAGVTVGAAGVQDDRRRRRRRR